MRVGFITEYYESGILRLPRTLARYLVGRGKAVTLVTPTAESVRVDRSDAAVTVRVGSAKSRSTNGLRRALAYLSFSLSSTLRVRSLKRVDVAYVYATQMTAAISAGVAKRLYGVPFVLHIQDVWPDSVTGSGMAGPPWFAKLVGGVLDLWVSKMYRRADAVIAISPEMRELLVARGSEASKTYSVYNWAPPAEFVDTPYPRDDSTLLSMGVVPGGTTFVYAGNMGPLQDLRVLLEAMEMLESTSSAHLWMVGDGVCFDELKEWARAHELTNVTFTGRVRPEEVRPILMEADYLLVVLKDLEIFRTNVPSKLQAALAAGKPVVTNVEGAVSNIVKTAGAGFVARAGDAKALACTIEEACALSDHGRDSMGKSAREYYEQHMAETSGLRQIEEILIRIGQERQTSRRKPRGLAR